MNNQLSGGAIFFLASILTWTAMSSIDVMQVRKDIEVIKANQTNIINSVNSLTNSYPLTSPIE
jgi:hypothetical protein